MFGKILGVSHNTANTKFYQNPPICSQDMKQKKKKMLFAYGIKRFSHDVAHICFTNWLLKWVQQADLTSAESVVEFTGYVTQVMEYFPMSQLIYHKYQ